MQKDFAMARDRTYSATIEAVLNQSKFRVCLALLEHEEFELAPDMLKD